MSQKVRLLFVDDEQEFLNYMTKRLRKRDIEVAAFGSAPQALAETEGQVFDVALLDLKMPEMDGQELLQKLKERDPRIEVIMLTGHGTIQSAFHASQSGAFEYLLKPCDFDGLVSSINNAYARRIKTLSAEKTRMVDDLMEHAGGMSPLALLHGLRRINEKVGKYVSWARLAEGGDPGAAGQLMDERAEEDET